MYGGSLCFSVCLWSSSQSLFFCFANYLSTILVLFLAPLFYNLSTNLLLPPLLSVLFLPSLSALSSLRGLVLSFLAALFFEGLFSASLLGSGVLDWSARIGTVVPSAVRGSHSPPPGSSRFGLYLVSRSSLLFLLLSCAPAFRC